MSNLVNIREMCYTINITLSLIRIHEMSTITIQYEKNHEVFRNKNGYKTIQNRGLTSPPCRSSCMSPCKETNCCIVTPLQKKKDFNIPAKFPPIYDCYNNGDICWFILCWITHSLYLFQQNMIPRKKNAKLQG